MVVIGSDSVMEWSPHLMRRTVVNVPFGTEWRPELQSRVLGLWAGWQSIEDAYTLWHVTNSAFDLQSFGALAPSEQIARMAAARDPRVEVEVFFDNGMWSVARFSPAGHIDRHLKPAARRGLSM